MALKPQNDREMKGLGSSNPPLSANAVPQFSDISENRSKSTRVRAICVYAWTRRAYRHLLTALNITNCGAYVQTGSRRADNHRPGAAAAFHGLPVPYARGARREVDGRAAAQREYTRDRQAPTITSSAALLSSRPAFT